MFSDRNFNQFNNKDYQRLFILGAVLGGLIFVLIYGVYVINPSYTQWIYYADNDLKQHFIGWCNYRNSQWKFPVGLIDTLSYPVSISTVYTDSIPGVALIFKLLSGILPADFQYFGLVGLLFYCLSGGTSVVLLKRFIKSPWVCLMAAPLFIVSFPMIQRMFYHTALAAQWIIFMSFIIWAYDTYEEKTVKNIIYWGIMGMVCVSVHSYFLPMAGMIMLADRICYFAKNKSQIMIKRIINSLLPIAGFCITAVITLWIYGGFYGTSSGVGEGLGTFGANFNTFINPGYYGALLPEMGYENYFQYEGCGYLGLGIILISLLVDVILIIKIKKREMQIPVEKRIFYYTAFGLFIVSFLTATLPKISVGTHNLGMLKYPDPIYKIASIFRSNGRFIWVAMYMIMLFYIVLAVKYICETGRKAETAKGSVSARNKILYLVLGLVLLVQTGDLSKMIKEKNDFYNRNDYEYFTMWESDTELSKMTEGRKAFVFLYTENDINMEASFYAYRHNMTLNSFYFARDITEEVESNIKKYLDELSDGLVRDDTVYIMKSEDYDLFRDAVENLNVKIKETDGHMIFVSK